MRTPPRLLARTLAVTLVTVTAILAVVFVMLTIDTRDRVRTAESEKLRVSGDIFSQMERHGHEDREVMLGALAEQPRIKAAIETYVSELKFAGRTNEVQLRDTVNGALAQTIEGMPNETLIALDADHRVFAAAGPARDRWPTGTQVAIEVETRSGAATFQDVAVAPGGEMFSITGARLRLGDRDVAMMLLARPLDANYALELSNMAGAGIVIAAGTQVLARTVPEAVAADLAVAGSNEPMRQLQGEEWAIARIFDQPPVRIYSLTSIDRTARNATRSALGALATVALGAFGLAALGSFWLARTVSDPIDRLSRDIETMSATRAFGGSLQPTGSSRELDALATAFNDLMRGLTHAEGETRAAYVGAIRALAAALDARDPYTAGHSERVSAYSVMIARHLSLSEADVDVIRLGALLHDIGKIGVADEVLRKPGALAAEEFEQIKRHPALGARILSQVPFLAPHLSIVELHHERPDGRGYPFGLRADDIPLAARIVHVADAFDAMTSARAYRPARPGALALDELRRCSGTEFDPATVEAICAAMPSASTLLEPQLQELLGRGA